MASSTWVKLVSTNSQLAARERRREPHSRSHTAGATSIALWSNRQQDPLQPAQERATKFLRSVGQAQRCLLTSPLCRRDSLTARAELPHTPARPRTHARQRCFTCSCTACTRQGQQGSKPTVMFNYEPDHSALHVRKRRNSITFLWSHRRCPSWQPGCHRVRETMGPYNELIYPRGTKTYMLNAMLSLFNETDYFK